MSISKQKEILIREVVRAINQHAGLDAEYVQGTNHLDVRAAGAGQTVSLEIAACTPTLDTSRVSNVLELAETKGEPFIVIAGKLDVEHADVLRMAGISYADTNGGVYLNAPGVLVLLPGRDRVKVRAHLRGAGKLNAKARIVGKAFQPAGLKAVLPLLVDSGRINEPYREIAKRVGISAASVKQVIDDLERLGVAIKMGHGRSMRRRIVNMEELAVRWAQAYGDRLRHKLFRGAFRIYGSEKRPDWKQIALDPEIACWGGEPAANVFLDYLRPLKLALYSSTQMSVLARHLRIIPDPEGPIEVFEKFWRNDVEIVEGKPVVPMIVAYADLITSQDSRMLETAQMLFDEWKDRTGSIER